MIKRCGWVKTEQDAVYHDAEWGNPTRDDGVLFEFLALEGMQAGLSWATILRKREALCRAFCGFDPQVVARFTDADVARLKEDASIIRSERKIRAVIANAARFLEVQQAFGSFADYLWGFVDGAPIVTHFARSEEAPAKTDLSEALSKDLKKRGFSFVGPVICYAYMQAVGMVNDHEEGCAFKYSQPPRA
ncbi:DNA-3-methyladenine glycosylase I [Oscillospiraceae bacterium OttesenSCG-928-F05]|nr:DNA-3-methyladenine glycosylase I [Oscillospiraceae bacterium OttesenSCG-928-F05]